MFKVKSNMYLVSKQGLKLEDRTSPEYKPDPQLEQLKIPYNFKENTFAAIARIKQMYKDATDGELKTEQTRLRLLAIHCKDKRDVSFEDSLRIDYLTEELIARGQIDAETTREDMLGVVPV